MKINRQIAGILLLGVLLLGGSYWLGSYITTAQMATKTQASTNPMMNTKMEDMGNMKSGMMGNSMMMNSMGNMDEMHAMMAQMQQMMADHMQQGMGNMMNAQPAEQPMSPPSTMLDRNSLKRVTTDAELSIASTFMNPLSKPESLGGILVFHLVLDTHSANLMQYNLETSAVIRTSEGLTLSDGMIWVPLKEESHHREGLLIANSGADGKPVITEKTARIELELKKIGSSPRLFQWELNESAKK